MQAKFLAPMGAAEVYVLVNGERVPIEDLEVVTDLMVLLRPVRPLIEEAP